MTSHSISSKAPRRDQPESVSIAHIRQSLQVLPGKIAAPPPEIRHAAVAVIFAGEAESPQLCLIRRADREGDPWSGQMAFPGGKQEMADGSLRAAAERETLEEVGMKLAESHFIAGLDDSPVRSGGEETGMRLFPYVYYLGEERFPLLPNREVAEAFWIPLSHILDPANFVEMPLLRNGEMLKFPSVIIRRHHIWGVSYRVLAQFAQAISRPLPESI